MTDTLRELYQEVILDHSKHPRNFRKLNPCSHEAHGHNPLCGDTIDVFVILDENDVIEDVSFDGKGCAISIASASLMTEILKEKTVQEAQSIFKGFQQLVTGENDKLDIGETTDRLMVLAGVKQFPSRVKCATLSWYALQSALEGTSNTSTEQS